MSSFAAKAYYPSLTDNDMGEDSTIATLSAPIAPDGTCSKHPHIVMRRRNSDGTVFQRESCPECEKEILEKAAALRAGRAQVGKELEKLDSSNHNDNNPNNNNNGNGMNDPYRYGAPNDDRSNGPHYGNGPSMGMQDNGGMYRGNNGNNNNSSNTTTNNSGPAPSPYFAPTPAPPQYGNDTVYSRSSQLTMDSLASQMNMMQQMQDRMMQQKEMEMQGLRQKVEQQQQELMKKEIEIALLKDRLSQQDERLQQELKYMELQYASKANSSGKSNRNGTKKEIHIKSLHVSVNGADGGKNPEDIDPKVVQEATAKATTAAIENAERQMDMGHTKVNKTRMVLDGSTGTANHKDPSPQQRQVMAEPPSPKVASSPVPDVYQAPPQQQQQKPSPPPPPQQQPRHQPTPSPPPQQDRVIAPSSMSNNSNAMANIINIADKGEDEQEYVQDDDSDAKIIEDVDAQEAADLRQEEQIMGMKQKELALAEGDDDDEEDQDDGYELVKQPEPVVKEERKEYTFTPPGANPKEEPVPASVADEEDDEAEGEDEFNPDPVWEAPGSEIKPKAAPEPAPFKQGPLTQAVAASRAPAVDLNPSRNNPEESGFDNIGRPDYHRHSSIPRDLNIGGDIVGDEDVTMATFEVNSVFRGHGNDGEDGRSMGGTVASSTYGEDRQKVVEQTLLDPYGDKGRYTGVVLRSTGMPHGLGRMLYEDDGRTYEGDWRHGRWHGHGHATFANGDSYEGEYRFDQRHGRGIYSWNDGRVYDGVFAEDKRHGTGTFKWPDGATYVGDFVQGQREGKGRYTFSDGGYYNGEWVDGRYEGYGECHWEDGRTYKGEWQSGMAHGKGSETYPDGRVRHSGQWMNDEPIRE